jgi:hypothetical protein
VLRENRDGPDRVAERHHDPINGGLDGRPVVNVVIFCKMSKILVGLIQNTASYAKNRFWIQSCAEAVFLQHEFAPRGEFGPLEWTPRG